METPRYRHLVLPYVTGNVLDIGSGGEPVVPHAIQVELSRTKDYGQRDMTAANIEWEGDGLNLPYKDGTVDTVFSSHLLEDFADWRPALAEWTRVLKPGGNLVILLPDRYRWQRALANGQPPNDAHKHEGKVGELTGYAAEFGWDVIEDRLTDLDPADYSILFVAKKRFDAPSIARPIETKYITFAHAGDLGDVLAHCAAMRAIVLAAGPEYKADISLYRSTEDRRDPRHVRQVFDANRSHNIGALLGEQEWVGRWRYESGAPKPGQVDYDFGDWREWYATKTDGKQNLSRSACEFFKVDPAACDVPWLRTLRPIPAKLGDRRLPVVICRSHRYRDPEFPWAEIAEKFRHYSFCIGSPTEAEELIGMYGLPLYLPTDTLSEVASVVEGADIVITNQTSTFWVAKGLGKRAIIMERYAAAPNCDFPGLLTGRDEILAYLDTVKIAEPEKFKPTRPPIIRGVREPEPEAVSA